MHLNILESILIVLVTVLCVTIVFRYIRLPVIFGYIVAGVIIGPYALALLPNLADIRVLADFGVVFLMFTVGLEFSLTELFKLKFAVFVLGGCQVFVSIIVTTFIGRFFGMTWLSAIVVGGIVAMSSTAIVLKLLKEQRELKSIFGQNTLGILCNYSAIDK